MHHPIVSIIVVTWNRKNDVIRCISSIKENDYSNYEILVVDNASTDGTIDAIKNTFPDVVLVANNKNLMAAGGRNVGINIAKGEYLLFIDSDNVIDKQMISELTKVLSSDKKIGMVGPKMFYLSEVNRLIYAGAKISHLTGKTTYEGNNKLDNGEYNQMKETGHIPNVFMVKKSVQSLVGVFDEKYKIMYEEADFAQRIINEGFKIIFVPQAITYHDVPFYSKANNKSDLLINTRLNNCERLKLFTTNRYMYLSKFSKFHYQILFLGLFQFFIMAYYAIIFIKLNRVDLLNCFLKGIVKGNKIMIAELI